LVSNEQVLDALRGVNDPELHRDVVSLGMIQDLKTDGGTVSFTFNLTTPACPLRAELEASVRSALRALPGVKEVKMKTSAHIPATRLPDQAEVMKGVKNIIAVASGKGGVGKSTVAVNLAVSLAAAGARVGLLDADIYGPTVPVMMGVKERPGAVGNMMVPPAAHGVKVISLGFFYKDDTPLVWRGPMVAGAVKQLLTQVEWGDLDYLIVDLPPGTGDASLTLAQTVPLGGVVIVTTPQEASLNIATKSLAMFRKLNVPILGIVENMSYFSCPHCLPPAQNVITSEGLKPISKVRVGEYVLTHKGRYRRVIEKFVRDYSGWVATIGTKSARTPEFEATLTEDHPVLTRHVSHRKDGNILETFAWSDASSLEVARQGRSTDLVAFPRISQIEDIRTIHFYVRYRQNQKRFGLRVGPELMTLLGYYLAEGSITGRKKRGLCAVRFTFGKTEKEFGYAMELASASFRLGFAPNVCKEKSAWRVEISSVVLARWLAKDFGRGAKAKRVPMWVKLLPPEKLDWLFACYVNGDGHRAKVETNVTTISLQLAASMRDIGLKLGYVPSISVRKGNATIQGRHVLAKRIYRVGFTRSRKARFDCDYVYLRVKRVKRSRYTGKVYNLAVDEDNSFCTPYQAVHNCGEKTYIFAEGGGKRAAKALDAQFLGEIPIYPLIREQSDMGTPVSAAAPSSPESAAFKDIAFKVAGMVSIVAYENSR
jgi:ATP-binding protein involved in chromosome partitioning